MEIKFIESIQPNQALILPFWQDNIDKEKIKQHTGIENIDFEAKYKEIVTLFDAEANPVHLVGLGKKEEEAKLTDLFSHLAVKQKKLWKSSVQLDNSVLTEEQTTHTVTGLVMGNYDIGRYKKTRKKEKANINTIHLVGNDFQDAANIGKETAETINDIKHLVDAPANVKKPEYLAEWALQSAKQYGYECEIFDENKMKELGFHAALSVGKGSQYPPRIIICKHLPKPDEAIDLVLAGKGVTFDTGGISIKPSNNMHYMKSDMGGAAAVLGTLELIAKLKTNKNVIGIVGAAENAVDALSYLPGDIIDSYSGKTIEVINTDAEGRLVLADCLNYSIKQFKPKQVIDLATLTGSAVRALGFSAAALFTKNNSMQQQLIDTGNVLYERVWPMPLFDEFAEDLHSDVADISNLGATPVAGAITAAKFLEAFTEKHPSWAHLDIAGVAFGKTDYAKMKSATGFGVRLLFQYIQQL